MNQSLLPNEPIMKPQPHLQYSPGRARLCRAVTAATSMTGWFLRSSGLPLGTRAESAPSGQRTLGGLRTRFQDVGARRSLTLPAGLLLAALLCLQSVFVRADIAIPSDGSDGVFAPTNSVEIDLGLAATAAWNTPSPVAGNGVYDGEQWAVVFKYASVNIPAGVKVTFKNHPAKAPVVWLVNGPVVIAGEVNLDGEPGGFRPSTRMEPARGGPGGFRGGIGAFGPAISQGDGLGPGRLTTTDRGTSGAYSQGVGDVNLQGRGYIYGNSSIVPLIGGSGGSGSQSSDPTLGSVSGGAGAGAILIASRSSIEVRGSVSAKTAYVGGSASGAGGAIRLIADEVSGSGTLTTYGGLTGSPGRIRIEANHFVSTLNLIPETFVVPPANPPRIWPETSFPKTRVVSVNATAVPSDPRSDLGPTADLTLKTTGSREVVVETRNMATTSSVKVMLIPLRGKPVVVEAVHQSGDAALSTWTAQVDIPKGFAAMQVVAVE